MIDKKLSSGIQDTDTIIFEGPCYYYGFTAVTGKTKFQVTIYDALSATGTEVEDYSTDAAKEMDGHSHSTPVVCSNGLYLALGGGTAIVYYVPQGV